MYYKIQNGYDTFQGRRLYRVIGTDNDYAGLWTGDWIEAEKELIDMERNA